MPRRKTLFIIYTWLTAALWLVVIVWFSSLKNLEIYSNKHSITLERITYALAFGFLLLLVFRALISTFKLTVDKLAFARSLKERNEDREFVIIVETLLLSNSILICILTVIGNTFILNRTEGREVDTYSFMINILSVLCFALLTYSWPILNTLELKAFKIRL